MGNRKKLGVAAAVAASTMAGVAIGFFVFGPGAATASTQSTGTTVAATPSAGPSFRSNEDPQHEAGESAEQEAAENAGRPPFGGPGPHGWGPRGCGSNEDPAHEKAESAAQEAAENARASACPTPSAAPSA
jgi:hypothetical protein